MNPLPTFSAKIWVEVNGDEVFVVANGHVEPADCSVGIMEESLVDVTFCHPDTAEDLDIEPTNWDDVYASIWAELKDARRRR